ncbi:hypothetical protein OAD55_04635 [Planktomarina temperata]|nr:hypothetical protein [Planktomarina temperata]
MATYYLKATDEQALWTALEAADLAVKDYDPEDPLNSPPADYDYMEDGEFVKTGAYEWRSLSNMLDIIGTMYRETGTMLTTDDGMEYPETEAISGYHANLREVLTDEQEAALPTVAAPATPYRKWAGDN